MEDFVQQEPADFIFGFLDQHNFSIWYEEKLFF